MPLNPLECVLLVAVVGLVIGMCVYAVRLSKGDKGK